MPRLADAVPHRAGRDDPRGLNAARERQNADLLNEVAAAIREAGGWAPEQVYPPLWLLEESNNGG